MYQEDECLFVTMLVAMGGQSPAAEPSDVISVSQKLQYRTIHKNLRNKNIAPTSSFTPTCTSISSYEALVLMIKY